MQFCMFPSKTKTTTFGEHLYSTYEPHSNNRNRKSAKMSITKNLMDRKVFDNKRQLQVK